MTVSRETVAELAGRFELPSTAPEAIGALLEALAAERDPPTTVRAPAEALDRHVADSLVALGLEELRAPRRLADLGAGAGFPGLPLAVARPRARVDLIESSARKARVSERLARAGGIDNVRAIVARAEEWAAAPPPAGGRGAYDVVTARALAPLAVLIEYAAPLLSDGGALVAWRGRRDRAEEAQATAAAAQVGLTPRRIVRVAPFAGARDRHLHVYVKTQSTPERFPRRPGVARKRPLGT